jgi:hypothetical protein
VHAHIRIGIQNNFVVVDEPDETSVTFSPRRVEEKGICSQFVQHRLKKNLLLRRRQLLLLVNVTKNLRKKERKKLSFFFDYTNIYSML